MKKNTVVILSVLYFVIYLIVGLFAVKDYGFTYDEGYQRRHSYVAYKYINEKLFNRHIDALSEYSAMADYEKRFYGTAMQMPMVLAEDLTRFTMTEDVIYKMRHYFTFIYCYIGYIFFYFALWLLFKEDKWLPLFGTMMISLYPRFFSIQFTDIKNMIFAALTMAVFFFMIRAVEKKTVISYLLFGASCALATNQRIMAIIYPAVFAGYVLVCDLRDILVSKKKVTPKVLIKYLVTGASFYLLWLVVSPFAWEHPISGFRDTFTMFSNYTIWKGTMVFMGKIITPEELPWYYLPVWILISVPVVYLLWFFAAHISLIAKMIKTKKPFEVLVETDKWQFCSLILFHGIILAIIVLKSRIYIGWHHVYFAFVPFCVAAVYGMKWLCDVWKKKYVYVLTGGCLVLLCAWMIYYHPYEPSFLNVIGKPFGAYFDREEWRTASYPALKWIMENDEGVISVKGERGSIKMLSPEDRERVIKEKPSKYYIDCYRNVVGNEAVHEGYEEIYSVSVDGYKVCSVYRLK